MSRDGEDDRWSSPGEDEAILTPSTESVASCDVDEQPRWLFMGNVVDPYLEDNGRPRSAPALAVHRGRLFCLWAGERELRAHLCWTSLDSHGRWDVAREMCGLSAGCERPVHAVGAPAIAELNGVLHVVFGEGPPSSERAPDRRDTLVHMQYDDQHQTWGKRTNLRISAGSSISLKGHEGRLHCAFTLADQELGYATWSEVTGWSHGTTMPHSRCPGRSFALCNVGDSLHVLYASGPREEQTLHDLERESTTWCWWPSQTPPRLEEPVGDGLDVTSCEGQVYIAHRDSALRAVLMVTNLKGQCLAREKVHSDPSWTLPAIAIVGGNLICVWVGGSDSHRRVLWSQRRTTPSISLKEWMSRIDSDVCLSELSIPGSHESCATIAIPWVQCQNISIDDQLTAGIRYFDFRCGVSFGSLYLFHGRSPLALTLTDVLARMYAWLTRLPTEAIMLQIKMEGGTGDEAAFEKLLRVELTENATYWALGNAIPKLGAVRGKIQLMRRFHVSSGTLGIDVGQWADNSPRFVIPLDRHQRMVVQDQYEYTDVVPTFAELVRTKWSAIDTLITAAKNDPNPKAWYLNWCNAYALPVSLGVVATPADIAMGRNDIIAGRRHFVPGVNSAVSRNSFMAPVKGRYGTILLDFLENPDPGLVAVIVMTNTLN